MDSLMQYLFAPVIFLTLLLTVIFSYRSRRATDGAMRMLYGARMNISMGVMLIFIAGVQLFLSNESTVRIVIGTLFMVIGLFNLFAGLRNLSMLRTTRR
ncbi:YtpI family protein [Paenibacillus algorifonticola]|uniref:YtpI family protein n=1 Tax=Paenibacillus algorifonticola TaxID=684063 RepID=UPI003D27FFDB